jgi:hypothetical protein
MCGRGRSPRRISGWLGDDLDIQAAQSVSGLSGRDALRGTVKNHRGATPTERGSSAVGLGRADATACEVTQV